MTTEAGGNGNVPFLKNVQEVKGNEELFFVKTSSKHSANEIWVVIESDIVNQKEDYREIEQIELEKILDTLKIDIHKIFN